MLRESPLLGTKVHQYERAFTGRAKRFTTETEYIMYLK